MRKPSWKRILICLAVQSAITIVTLFVKGITSVQSAMEVYMVLSDGFFMGGALMVLAAGLSWTAGQGVADGLSYGISRFFKRRGPGYEENRREGYAEYKERKHAHKPQVMELLISGLAFVLVAFVFLALYSNC